jgi:hypothetical protein
MVRELATLDLENVSHTFGEALPTSDQAFTTRPAPASKSGEIPDRGIRPD